MNRTWDRINFAAFLISNALSFGAMWGQRIVMGWLIWQLTGSPLWLAASASIELSSTFVLTPLVGVWLDRYRRDHILIVSQVVATIITGGFAAASIAEVLTPSLLIAVNATLGCAGAIYLPARLALLADVKGAPPSQSAHSALAIASQIGAFVGPTIIGIALSMHNASVAAALLCSFNAMATLTMLGIATKAPDHDVKSARTDQHTWRSAIAYWTASKTKVPTLLFIFFLTVVAVRGVMDLLPAYVAVVLTGDAELLSQLIAAAGFGALTTSLTLVPLGQCDPNRQIRLSLLLALTATVCMTVSHDSLVATMALGLLGAGASLNTIATQTLLLKQSPPAIKGRASALFAAIWRGGPIIGAGMMAAVSYWHSIGTIAPTSAGLLALTLIYVLCRRCPVADR